MIEKHIVNIMEIAMKSLEDDFRLACSHMVEKTRDGDRSWALLRMELGNLVDYTMWSLEELARGDDVRFRIESTSLGLLKQYELSKDGQAFEHVQNSSGEWRPFSPRSPNNGEHLKVD